MAENRRQNLLLTGIIQIKVGGINMAIPTGDSFTVILPNEGLKEGDMLVQCTYNYGYQGLAYYNGSTWELDSIEGINQNETNNTLLVRTGYTNTILGFIH